MGARYQLFSHSNPGRDVSSIVVVNTERLAKHELHGSQSSRHCSRPGRHAVQIVERDAFTLLATSCSHSRFVSSMLAFTCRNADMSADPLFATSERRVCPKKSVKLESRWSCLSKSCTVLVWPFAAANHRGDRPNLSFAHGSTSSLERRRRTTES
jgi:hypothetical protein